MGIIVGVIIGAIVHFVRNYIYKGTAGALTGFILIMLILKKGFPDADS